MAVRVDKWLWAVRVFKTRRQATDACTAGRIRINGEVGDIVQAARRDRTIIYVAHELLEKRVSAPLAAAAVEDRSPPPPKKQDHLDLPVFAQRDRGSGRPTKKDRRAIDKLRGERRS
jgi:ribosome-associated heat shock protein Hsp15